MADLFLAVQHLNKTHELTGGIRGMVIEQFQLPQDNSRYVALCYCPNDGTWNSWVVWTVTLKLNGGEDWTDSKSFANLWSASIEYGKRIDG